MMSLLPLPTANVAKTSTLRSELPYPELNQRQAQPQPELRKQWGEKKPENTEQDRLKELEQMLNDAQSRAAIVEQEAYDKAYAAGEKAGLALGEKRAEQILESMTQVVAQAEQELQNLQHQSIEVIVELTDSITKRIVGDSPKDIASTLEKAVNRSFTKLNIGTQHKLMLVVHPNDLEMFERMKTLPEGLNMRADDKIVQGSCKLLSSHQDTLIDPKAMIEKAVSLIRKQFLRLYDE